MSLYEDLGLPKGASRDQIKKAFRKKAMRAHPDRPGGNAEEFRKIERAYSVLYDPLRRERYDQDGREDAAPEQNQDLIMLAQLLMAVIENAPVETVNVLSAVADHVRAKQNEIRQSVKNLRKQAAKFVRAAKRLSRKTDGPNILVQMLESRISQAESDAERAESHLETGEHILKLLSEYSYKTDPQKYQPSAPFMSLQDMMNKGFVVHTTGR